MITKFYYEKGLIIIPAQVSGIEKPEFPVVLALDAGSFYTNLKPDLLEKIGATGTNEKALLLGVGERVVSTFAILKSFNALGFTVENFKVTSHALP